VSADDNTQELPPKASAFDGGVRGVIGPAPQDPAAAHSELILALVAHRRLRGGDPFVP
jgi:hypothetical protein